MTNHAAFIRRLADLTRNDTLVWDLSPETQEYSAKVDAYSARLGFMDGAKNGGAPVLRFALYRRDELMAEVNSRRSQDFRTSDDSAYALKNLFEAVQRQQASRETAAFEEFLSRVEA